MLFKGPSRVKQCDDVPYEAYREKLIEVKALKAKVKRADQEVANSLNRIDATVQSRPEQTKILEMKLQCAEAVIAKLKDNITKNTPTDADNLDPWLIDTMILELKGCINEIDDDCDECDSSGLKQDMKACLYQLREAVNDWNQSNDNQFYYESKVDYVAKMTPVEQ